MYDADICKELLFNCRLYRKKHKRKLRHGRKHSHTKTACLFRVMCWNSVVKDPIPLKKCSSLFLFDRSFTSFSLKFWFIDCYGIYNKTYQLYDSIVNGISIEFVCGWIVLVKPLTGTQRRFYTVMYSISQEICTRFLLCCALLWSYIDWFSHIHQAYFTGTVAI